MQLLPYESYKDANSPWLGKLPANWTESKFSFVKRVLTDYTANGSFADLKKNVNYKYSEDYAVLVRLTDLRNNLEAPVIWVDEHAYKYLKKSALFGGEFLLANVGAHAGLFWQMPKINKPATLAPNMFMARFENEKVTEEFMAYVAKSDVIEKQLRLRATGSSAQPKLNKDDFKSIVFIYPCIKEQTQIAKFLDYKTAQIDRLIEKKKALIEKLNEQRIAMITQAVTKGLNPDAPMKDSEVGWLGEVPEHWEIKPLKFSFNNLNNRRIPLSAEERTGMPKNYRYYGASGVIDMVENYIFDEPTVLIGEDGANLLSRSTPLAFEATGKYWVNNHAHILSPIEGPFSYWSNLLCIVQYDPWITGSAQPKLTKDNLGSILLPRPPVEEQHSIADFVNKTASKIDPMIDLAETTIEKLNEYRTALITAAVTGKIDVREVEIPKQGAA